MDAIDRVAHHGNLYLDLSSALQVFLVRSALNEVPDRCLFGPNTPHGDVLAARMTVESATVDAGVLAAPSGTTRSAVSAAWHVSHALSR